MSTKKFVDVTLCEKELKFKIYYVDTVVDTGHQSVRFFQIMRRWISNLGH